MSSPSDRILIFHSNQCTVDSGEAQKGSSFLAKVPQNFCSPFLCVMRQAFPNIQAAARDQHASTNHLQYRKPPPRTEETVTKSRDDSQFDANHQVGWKPRQMGVRDEEEKGAQSDERPPQVVPCFPGTNEPSPCCGRSWTS
jgi:hypothetical protein